MTREGVQYGMLLREKDDGGGSSCALAGRIVGAETPNAASAFWVTLGEELRRDFAVTACVELTWTCHEWMDRSALSLLADLEATGEDLATRDFSEAMTAMVAELDLHGPPPPVHAVVRDGEATVLERDLPQDCVDADLMSYLVGWLYAWAGIPEAIWNHEFVQGSVLCCGIRVGRRWRGRFDVRNCHLSEGLSRRVLTLSVCPEPAGRLRTDQGTAKTTAP